MKKLFLLLVLLLSAALLLSACGGNEEDGTTAKPAACEHEWQDAGVMTPADCEQAEVIRLYCPKCQAYDEREGNPALGHILTVNEQKATCYESGHRSESCSRCSYTNEVHLPAGHTLNEASWVMEHAPSEADTGSLLNRCTVCQDGVRKNLPALNTTDYTLSVIDEDTKVYTYRLGDRSFEFTVSNFTFMQAEGEWPFTFDVWVVTGYTGDKTAITLPSTYMGGPVVGIATGAFQYKNSLLSVTIPDATFTFSPEDVTEEIPEGLPEEAFTLGYQSIGYAAFSECGSLTTVILPDSLTDIESNAFAGCSSLTAVAFPDSLTYVGNNAFANCTSLTSASLGGVRHLASCAFFGCTALESFSAPLLEEINGAVFEGCTSLKTVTVPACESISAGAFRGCSSLLSFDIPATVTSIGRGAFFGCSSLAKLSGPIINDYGYATYLGYLFGAESYWDNASYVPASLKEVTIAGTAIAEGALRGCTGIEKVVLLDTVETVASGAFADCSIKSIRLSSSLRSIRSDSFSGVAEIAYTAYENGYYLGNEENPYLFLILVDTYAINNSRHDLVLHEDTKLVARGILDNCDGLTSLTVPAGILDLGGYNNNRSNRSLNLYYGGTLGEFCAVPWNYPYYTDVHLFLKNGSTWEEVTELVIPDGTTAIPAYKFHGFASITSVILPASITELGERAFSMCEALDKVYYKGTVEEWCLIERGGSWGDGSVMDNASHFYMQNGDSTYFEVTSIKIPNTVTALYEHLFYGFDNLTSVIIPKSVTYLSDGAFASCPALTVLYYEGNAAEWNAIGTNTGIENFLPGVVKSFYSENAPTALDYQANPTLSAWHYGAGGAPELWAAPIDPVAGSTYAYISSSVSVSNELWSMIETLKSMGMLDEMFDLGTVDYNIANTSSTKAEYEANLAAYYATTADGLTVSFSGGKVSISQNGQSVKLADYYAIENEIYYVSPSGLAFTVTDSGAALLEAITVLPDLGGFTVTHRYEKTPA